MNLIESLEDELGRPLIDWEGSAVHAHRQPIVYVWLRDETVLYIGQSARGFQRPIDTNHERLRDIEPGDRLVVFVMKSAKLALLWEERLIRRLSPRLNGPGRVNHRTLSLSALQHEARFLERKLEAVQQQMRNLHSVQDQRELRQRGREEQADSRFIFDVQNPGCLTAQSAAGRYHVDAATLRTAVRAGTLRAVRFGASLRFRPEWIEEWLILREPRQGDTTVEKGGEHGAT